MSRSTLKTKIKMHNNLKERIRVWRIGDFMRQFTIVTAGVMVTFIGSYLINSRSTDNQIESSMQLIIKELENNKEAIKDIQVKYEMDRTISQYLVDSSFIVDNFHIDTLYKYKRLISQISGFTYSSDALEVLKTSSLMQSIEDKDLLLRIIETYKNLGQIKEGMVEYYDLKKSVIIPIVLGIPIEPGSDTSTDSGDLRQTYKYMLSQKSTITFCRIATGFVDPGYFNASVADVDSTLNLLRSQYN